MHKPIISLIAVALTAVTAAVLVASPPEGEARKKIVETAQSFQGVPYVYGAESPDAFDCSGFVQYVYAHAAEIQIPRNSKAQWAAGSPIAKDAVKPGDIFVFDTTGAGGPSHVAIFLGGDKMIHAISEGPKTGVVISPLTDHYFGPRMIGARYFIVSAFPSDSTAAPAKPVVEAPKPVVEAPKPVVEAPKPLAAAKPIVAVPAANAPAVPAAPLKNAAALADEPPVAQIGFTVRSTPSVVMDKIPAATGTAIAFTIRNGTGKDNVFHIFFYKADVDFKKTRILREARAAVRAGEAQEIEAYTFTEPGVYRLNVKTADNTQLMQRTWNVIEAKH
jgi:NlpC/P60 family